MAAIRGSFNELLPPEEISFDSDVYLLLNKSAQELRKSNGRLAVGELPSVPVTTPSGRPRRGQSFIRRLRRSSGNGEDEDIKISGEIPTEVWNRLGRTLIPKLKAGTDLHFGINASVQIEGDGNGLQQEIEQILRDLNLADKVKVDLR